jgi:iron complex outermembrane recepter protein
METISNSALLIRAQASQETLALRAAKRRKSAGLLTFSTVATALLLAAGTGAWQRALADDTPSSSTSTNSTEQEKKKKDESLEEVVVTGSLIPQTATETSQPVTIITAEQLQQRGFSSVADALQQTSFATGSVQGPQFSGGFTPGAQTLSLFGLDPSYVKYLIDGLPMADYPALYNGTENITSITGIPIELVERVDVLPGGQSSIYGSDAIAGVVNVVMKKELDAPIASVRYGYTADGGGIDKRLALADSFKLGGLNIMVGGQYEKTTPIWGFQRPLTATYNTQGTSPETAERTYLIYGLYGAEGTGLDTYYFEDPSDCANAAAGYGGTVHEVNRPERGSYCGSNQAGFFTLGNGDEGAQVYVQATDDITSNIQFYVNALVDHDLTKFSAAGGSFYGSDVDDTSPFYYFYDPNLGTTPYAPPAGDLVNVQHIFTPEETGNINNIMDEDTTNAYRFTLGLRGGLGSSDWKYDAGFTYMDQKLTERTHLLFAPAVEGFYAPMFGADLGPDPFGFGVQTFEPNFASFYDPVTPAQYASFSGYATSYSYTEDSLARGQLTNANLFMLPGGPAGIALVLEGGDQGWNYAPDPAFFNGDAFGYTATAGSGHRSRWAGTTELRMPVFKMLTFTASGRYDDYKVAGGSVDKSTYNLGLEFRPWQSLLFRARYGTSFKAPTLADEFQGQSGFYETLTDYYTCAVNHLSLGNCPQANESVFGVTSGNTKLQPITAKDWDIGAVWSPVANMAINLDYLHFGITNEVTEESADLLLRTESLCRLGQLNINSPTCVAALAQVIRGMNGVLEEVYTPKINVSSETVNAVTLGSSYRLHTERAGIFDFQLSWSDMIDHEYVQYAGEAPYNLLTNPFESQEFKSKVNASLTWTEAGLSATVYANRVGGTPNYLATVNGYGTPGAGTLGAWTIYNFTASYQFTSALALTFTIDNVFGSMPPKDTSYPGTTDGPYNVFDYNVYGAAYFLEANYKFGK